MYMFDVETLGVESTSVILSAALLYYNEGDDYDTMIKNSLFVKFDVEEQRTVYKRTMMKETMEWWAKQHEHVRKVSFHPTKYDSSAEEGIQLIRDYVKKHGNAQVFARGSLDQMVIDSLTRQLDQELIFPYNNWRDVRTAVDLLCATSKDGYCEVKHPTFQRHNVIKHDPVHDCAYDAMMLLYGV